MLKGIEGVWKGGELLGCGATRLLEVSELTRSWFTLIEHRKGQGFMQLRRCSRITLLNCNRSSCLYQPPTFRVVSADGDNDVPASTSYLVPRLRFVEVHCSALQRTAESDCLLHQVPSTTGKTRSSLLCSPSCCSLPWRGSWTCLCRVVLITSAALRKNTLLRHAGLSIDLGTSLKSVRVGYCTWQDTVPVSTRLASF